MFGQPRLVPEENTEEGDADLSKRVKYLRRCKEVLWNRWSGEYLKSLRERHNMEHKTKEMNVKLGDVVLIQDAERNREKWNMGMVVKLFQGRDGVVRAVGLRGGKAFLERAVQHLFPLELFCDQEQGVRLMMFGQPRLVPEENTEEGDADLSKRVKYLRRCKEVLWNRWSGEYLKSLRERHNMEHKTKEMNVKLGDVVLIQDAERNREKWNMGMVVKLFQGRDGVVRAVGLRGGKAFLERAVQHLFPLELFCDQEQGVREDPPEIPGQGSFAPLEELQL